ncbi:MAG TPA: hypothetical protein VES19_11970 [Candidatus Limnocylindrales bacterium]|nr:hypothetical protein [Candidatus Limnocylindrales bacterium]
MDARRDIIDRIEGLGIRYFLTGSEAMAVLGIAFRATNDIDIVIDIEPSAYESRLRSAFEPDYLVSSLVPVAGKWLGSVIHVRQIVKADLVIRAADPWGIEALARATRVDDPGFGKVNVSTPEDLLLAKLEFAGGDLEGMQGRDCVRLLALVGDQLDLAYVQGHAARLRLTDSLAEVERRAHA